MKKFSKLIIVCSFMFFLIGCTPTENKQNEPNKTTSETVICTNETVSEDDLKTTEIVEVTAINDKVTKVIDTNIIEVDPTYLDFTYQIANASLENYNAIKGIKTTYSKEGNNKLKLVIEIDYSKLDADKIKETLNTEDRENSIYYSSKDTITLDEFKEKHLKDYNCN